MEHECKGCGKCCSLLCYVNLEDVEKWLKDDKVEIVACLTWHHINGRNPPDILYVPHKRHIIGHSFLGKFYKPDWAESEECIFYHNGKCTIYADRPSGCERFPQGKLEFKCPGISSVDNTDKYKAEMIMKERKKQNIKAFLNAGTLSKAVKQAKAQASIRKLTKLIRPDLTASKNMEVETHDSETE